MDFFTVFSALPDKEIEPAIFPLKNDAYHTIPSFNRIVLIFG